MLSVPQYCLILVLLCAWTVSGTALAAGFSKLFREQIPVASAIPPTQPTPPGLSRWFNGFCATSVTWSFVLSTGA